MMAPIENVKQLFPEVTLHSYKESAGYIVRRNEAVKLAQTPYVLSIDDDCVLENTNYIIPDCGVLCF